MIPLICQVLIVFSVTLIYAEKFEFKNAAIMEDKQSKQTERYSVMAKGSDCFLLLDDKSKQRYKVKINNTRVWFSSDKKVKTFKQY